MKRSQKILIYIIGLLIGLQFVPLSQQKVEKVAASQAFENIVTGSEAQITLLKNACYDCHSNDTKYPWYAQVAPVSLWINGHIKGARGKLNFSTWQQYDTETQKHKLRESAEEIRDGHMPPKSFKFMHSGAKMTDNQAEDLAVWLESI